MLPPGISLIAVDPVEQSKEISEVFGDGYEALNAAFKLDTKTSRWKLHQPPSNPVDHNIEAWYSLDEITPLFVDLAHSQDIPVSDLNSELPYQVATGWVLSPIRAGETLDTLTQGPGMERLFAIFGLEGGVWYGKIIKSVGVAGEIYNKKLTLSSTRELIELSSGRAYWFGFLPEGRRITIHSTRVEDYQGSNSRIRFGEDLNHDFHLSKKSIFLGSQESEGSGSWRGDIYVSNSARRIYSRLDFFQNRTDTNGYQGPHLSVADLPVGTEAVEIDRLPFSKLSSMLVIESYKKPEAGLSELNLALLGPILSVDGEEDPSPLSQAAFSLISTAYLDPFFEGHGDLVIEESPGAVIHQLANQLLDDSVLNPLDFMREQELILQSLGSRQKLRKNIYSSLYGDLRVSMLLNALSNLTDFSWIPTPHLEESSNGIILLNRFYLGDSEAKVVSILDQSAQLEPSGGRDFSYRGVPDALKLYLGVLGDPLDTNFDIRVRIENLANPENHFAEVNLKGFRLKTLSDYRVEAIFPEGQSFEFSFRVPTNNIVAASGSSKNKTLDVNDFRIGRTNLIEIPIASYLSKADGQFGLNLEEDFNMELNMTLEFTGTQFLLQGSSGYSFSKIKIPNVRLNN